MITFIISARNLTRNKRRTLITVGAMSFSIAVMIVYAGLMEGFFHVFKENAVDMDLSKMQIHAKGYLDNPSIYNRIDQSDELIDKLEQNGFRAAPRFYGFALAASGNASAGVQLRGVDVVREKKVTKLYQHVRMGSWLSPDDEKGVVIGRALAKTLNVHIQDEIVILGQAMDGSIANDIFRVKGILKSVSAGIDRAGFFMTTEAYRNLLSFSGGAHEIAIQFPSGIPLASAVSTVRKIAPDQDIADWKHLAPALAQLFDSLKVTMMLTYIIAYAAIGMLVLNAMLMAVFERIRELGIMKAVGLSPGRILTMIILESAIMTGLAAAAGLLTGLPISFYLQTHGIDLSGFGNGLLISGIAMDPVWRTRVTFGTVLKPIYFMAIMVFTAIIYPGFKAAFVRPIKAITHR